MGGGARPVRGRLGAGRAVRAEAGRAVGRRGDGAGVGHHPQRPLHLPDGRRGRLAAGPKARLRERRRHRAGMRAGRVHGHRPRRGAHNRRREGPDHRGDLPCRPPRPHRHHRRFGRRGPARQLRAGGGHRSVLGDRQAVRPGDLRGPGPEPAQLLVGQGAVDAAARRALGGDHLHGHPRRAQPLPAPEARRARAVPRRDTPAGVGVRAPVRHRRDHRHRGVPAPRPRRRRRRAHRRRDRGRHQPAHGPVEGHGGGRPAGRS